MLPYSNNTTSLETAASISQSSAASLRERVYRFILDNKGATDHEIQQGLGLIGSTERPRRWELVKEGRVEDSGERRLTPSGKRGIVWRLLREVV